MTTPFWDFAGKGASLTCSRHGSLVMQVVGSLQLSFPAGTHVAVRTLEARQPSTPEREKKRRETAAACMKTMKGNEQCAIEDEDRDAC